MSAVAITAVELSGSDPSRPLLVLGPSLGTSVHGLWQDALPALVQVADVVGWDLPGHATNTASGEFAGLTVEALAAEVAAMIEHVQEARGAQHQRAWYAGVSIGGAVGIALALNHPEILSGAVVMSAGARIGTAAMWHERAALVEQAGTPTQVEGAAQRWFAPGFIERRPEVVTRLLATLQTADRHAYAALCRALADFDLTDRLEQMTIPAVVVSGTHDAAVEPSQAADLASRIPRGRLRLLAHVGHQPPAEEPDVVAEIIVEAILGHSAAPGTRTYRDSHALEVRREVLGTDHVARATAGATGFTADFQDLITRYAWGEVWGRPGLDRRLRSAVTLTALVAGGHWEELEMHLRAALRNGLSADEIKEILLQTAIYCSVPSANHAFAIANRVLESP